MSYNLPEHTIQLTLQYLLPPIPPLPPHLLSTPLRARHNLLHLTDPTTYFSWPASCPDPPRLISLLESLSSSSLPSSRISPPSYAVPDEETLLASVDIAGVVRIVWKWEMDRRDWGYHDAMLLPAPSGTPIFSHRTADDALDALPIASLLRGPPPRSHSHSESSNYQLRASSPPNSSTQDPADYWGGYSSRSPSPSPSHQPQARVTSSMSAEDAYWASYGTVQGSGDSTVPSPVRPNPPLPAQQQQQQQQQQRPSTSRYPSDPTRQDTISISPDSSAHTFANTAARALAPPPTRMYRSTSRQGAGASVQGMPVGGGGADQTDEALTEAVRGIWKMWSVGRRGGGGHGHGAGGDKDAFLAAVRHAIEDE